MTPHERRTRWPYVQRHDREHETKKRANDASREENKVVLRTTRSEKQCFQDPTRHVVFNQNAARNSKQEIGFLPGVLRPIQASSQVAFHCNVHTTTTLARHLRADGRRRFCPPPPLSRPHTWSPCAHAQGPTCREFVYSIFTLRIKKQIESHCSLQIIGCCCIFESLCWSPNC